MPILKLILALLLLLPASCILSGSPTDHYSGLPDFWEQVPIPSVMNDGTVIVDRSNTIYLMQFGKGVYKSSDMGAHWSHCPVDTCIDFIVMDSLGRIIAGTQHGTFINNSQDTIWKQISTINTKYGSAMVSSGNVLFITTPDTLYALAQLETDNPMRFLVDGPSKMSSSGNLSCDRAGNLFVRMGYATYKSSDNGLTWHSVFGLNTNECLHTISALNNNRLIAMSNNYDTAIYYSNDSGEHWLPLATSVKVRGNIVYETHDLACFGDSLLIVSAFSGVYYSHDFGNTWSDAIVGLRNNSTGCTAGDLFIDCNGYLWTRYGAYNSGHDELARSRLPLNNAGLP
jgi:hypothetical protein